MRKSTAVLVLALVAACGVEQRFGVVPDPNASDGGAASSNAAEAGGGDANVAALDGDAGARDAAPKRSWKWLNPTPRGSDLRGMWGLSDSDIWLVGEGGAVLRWDGATMKDMYPDGPSDVTFVSVWASADDDVWVAGKGAGPTLAHWNGKAWSTDYSIARTERALRAVWGSGPSDVWVLTDAEGALPFHWDGASWELAYNAGAARGWVETTRPNDIGGTGPKDVWVAARDAVFHFDGSTWVRHEPLAFATYRSVWASSPSDVWVLHDRGIVHFDGRAWSSVQSDDGLCNESWNGVHVLRGAGQGAQERVVANIGDCIFLLAEGRWRGTDGRYSYGLWGSDFPRAFWMTPAGEVLAAADDGDLLRLRSELPTSDPWISASTQMREWLNNVSVGKDGSVWAESRFGVFRWTDAGWHREHEHPGSYLYALHANSASDVWISYFDDDYNQELVHFDGAEWKTTWQGSVLAGINAIWSGGPTSAWAVGNGTVLRWDGSIWTTLPVPDTADAGPDARWVSVSGTSADDVWIGGTVRGEDVRVLHWDGTSLREAFRAPANVVGRLPEFIQVWASASNDVWLGTGVHWDGTTWSTRPAEPVFSIWGRSPNDVWFTTYDGVRHWDGASFTTTVLTPASNEQTGPKLAAISGSADGEVWIVGRGGVTLRYSAEHVGPVR